jgi:hypothetical protein
VGKKTGQEDQDLVAELSGIGHLVSSTRSTHGSACAGIRFNAAMPLLLMKRRREL